MATNGQTIIKVTDYNNLIFRWNQTSQSVVNNNTTISWTLLLTSTSSGTITSTAVKNWYVTVNGINYSGTNSVGIPLNSTKTLASGSTVITHNADGAKSFSYSFTQNFGITFGLKLIGNLSGSGTGELETINRGAKLTVAPDFNDEDNPIIYYSNPAGEAVSAIQACISLTGMVDDIPYRDIGKTSTNYTFNLTEAERNILRNAVTSGNSRTVRFYIATTINGVIEYSWLTRTLTLVNNMPTISPQVYDTNSSTVALTGNDNIFIRGYSNAYYTMGATAYKGAYITDYYCTNGDKSDSRASGVLNGVTSSNFTFSATDSRGNVATRTIAASMVDYVPVTVGIESRELTTDGDLIVTLAGNYYNGSFGAKVNSLEISYTLKEDGVPMLSFNTGAITPTMTDGIKYTYSIRIGDLNYSSAYSLDIFVNDLLSNNSINEVVTSIPIFDWSKYDFNFNVPVRIKQQPLADFVVEQDSSGYWFYRKWSSGICEMWGWCEASYQDKHYLSTYQAYPVTLTDWISAQGTINNFGGNLSAYLPVNVKVEPFSYGCNVWVQNSNNSFAAGDKASVSLHIIGRWK